MKIIRIISIFLTVCMLSTVICNSAFAEVSEDSELDATEAVLTEPLEDINEDFDDMASDDMPEEAVESEKYISSSNAETVYSCVYDSQKQKILINGSVTHDTFINHRDYTIKLYKISPEEDVNSVIYNPQANSLASTEISIKFNFTADVKTVEDIFSQYVVVLVSPDGTVDYVGPQFYPSVESSYLPEYDRRAYKGVFVSTEESAIFQSEPMVGVIPVYFDKLISSSSTGYLYSLNNTNVFFNREYIDSLDRSIRTLYSSGSKVYLQFLLTSGSKTTLNLSDEAGTAAYDIPDLSSVSVMNEIYSYCDFLSDRYSTYEKGYISGIIIGKNLDDVSTYNNFESKKDYVETLALYGIIAGVAIRKNIPSADISYSFTNLNTYQDKHDPNIPFKPSEMIESISKYFDEFYSDDFDFSVTIEAYHSPLSISNEMLGEGIDLSLVHDEKYIVERNLDVFSNFLNSIDKKYSSNPDSFMYVWNVGEDLDGNALCCAYSYLYYKFFNNSRLTSFIVNFENNPKAIYDLINLIKYIDTEKGRDVTSQLLQFFREYTWENVVYGFEASDFVTREQKLLDKLEILPRKLLGEFSYFDFSLTTSDKMWFSGAGVDKLSIDYSSVLGRSLCAQFDSKTLSGIDYAYIFSSCEYPENYVFTPYLTWLLSIEGENDTPEIFEVKIAYESFGNIYELSEIVHTGEAQYIHMNLSEFSRKHMVDNIRVSVRPMSETEGEYRLCLSSIVGKSADFDNEELKLKIEEERLRIRNSSAQISDSSDNANDILIFITVILIAVMLGVMLFFFLKREDQYKE